MKKSKLSVIIPWCNREEIKQTLAQNRSFFSKDNMEFIIVNCGGNLEWLNQHLDNIKTPCLRKIDINGAAFNKCLAINLGVSLAKADYLFFLDADIILQDDFLDEAFLMLEDKCFLTLDKVFESNNQMHTEQAKPYRNLKELAYSIELTSIENQKVHIETNRVHLHEGSRSAPGLILLKADDFLAINGMNSNLNRWGWEDLDLIARLQFQLGLKRERIGSALHLSHDDKVRNLGDKSRAENESVNFSICLTNYSQANYQGTYKQDVESWQDKLNFY